MKPSLRLPNEVVVLDLETTGRVAGLGGHCILEVAAIKLARGRPLAVYHSLVRPNRDIPPAATRLTGITPAMVGDAPDEERVLPALVKCLGKNTIVAHGANFERKFLEAGLRRLEWPPRDRRFHCTLRQARDRFPGAPGFALSVLCRYLGLEAEIRYHRALPDARAAARLYLYLNHGIQRARPDFTAIPTYSLLEI